MAITAATPASTSSVFLEEASIEELARMQGAIPIGHVAELAEPEIFQTDDELDDFLADPYASRGQERA